MDHSISKFFEKHRIEVVFLKTINIASITYYDFISVNGIASGYLEGMHIAVNIFLLFLLDTLGSPTKSTFTCEISLIMGTDFKGAFCFLPHFLSTEMGQKI